MRRDAPIFKEKLKSALVHYPSIAPLGSIGGRLSPLDIIRFFDANFP